MHTDNRYNEHIKRMTQLRFIFLTAAIIVSVGAFSQQRKVVKNYWHAQVWLKDGTTDSGYVQNAHHSVWVYDDEVVLNNLDKFLGKNRRHATKDIDSMYVWVDTNPYNVIVSVPIPVNYSYGNNEPMVYNHPCMCYIIYSGQNVVIYEAWHDFSGDYYLYKTPEMYYAKALFRSHQKLSEKRRITLAEEFDDYPVIKDYIRNIPDKMLKVNPLPFFLLIDTALGQQDKAAKKVED